MEEDLTYNQASAELEKILTELRSDGCDVDTLASKSARAVELIKFCRGRLTATDKEIADILQTLQAPEQ